MSVSLTGAVPVEMRRTYFNVYPHEFIWRGVSVVVAVQRVLRSDSAGRTAFVCVAIGAAHPGSQFTVYHRPDGRWEAEESRQ